MRFAFPPYGLRAFSGQWSVVSKKKGEGFSIGCYSVQLSGCWLDRTSGGCAGGFLNVEKRWDFVQLFGPRFYSAMLSLNFLLQSFVFGPCSHEARSP
jgi:hypothetical protein